MEYFCNIILFENFIKSLIFDTKSKSERSSHSEAPGGVRGVSPFMKKRINSISSKSPTLILSKSPTHNANTSGGEENSAGSAPKKTARQKWKLNLVSAVGTMSRNNTGGASESKKLSNSPKKSVIIFIRKCCPVFSLRKIIRNYKENFLMFYKY